MTIKVSFKKSPNRSLHFSSSEHQLTAILKLVLLNLIKLSHRTILYRSSKVQNIELTLVGCTGKLLYLPYAISMS